MANVSKGYGVGDTVWVWYPFEETTLAWNPQSRVIGSVKILTAANLARVEFTNGAAVEDGSGAAERVFTTEALCATQIVDRTKANADAAAVLDATVSEASTAGQPTIGLGRSDV